MWRCCWLLLVPGCLGATHVFTGVVNAIPDGDTLWVQPDDGSAPRKLRLLGIDAPEICQAGGVASRDELVRLVAHQRVRVRVEYLDSYGRDLAHLEHSGQDIGAQMVRSGQAWSNRWRGGLGPYASEEALARLGKNGLFAMQQPEIPRDFRKRHGSCYPDK